MLATEGTLKTQIYNKLFEKDFTMIRPTDSLQIKSVNHKLNFTLCATRGTAEYIQKHGMKCKKIILGCTEIPIAIFAFKSFKKIKLSKTFLDPNLILAVSSMSKYK